MNTLELVAAIIRSSSFTITGRVGRDPEPKYFDSGKCKLVLSIAVNRANAKRDDNTQPDWFKVEFWNEDAQQAADELRKGDLVKVAGRLYTDTWTKRDSGEHVTDIVIKVEEWCPVVSGNPAPAPAQPPASTEEVPF